MSTSGNPMPRRVRFALIFGAIGTTALLAAGMPGFGAAGGAVVDAAAKAVTIKIDNFAFAPPDLAIAAGTTVTWKNDDGEVHKVQDDHRGFPSAALDTDDSWRPPKTWWFGRVCDSMSRVRIGGCGCGDKRDFRR
jgi:plastocyanin